MSFCSLWKTCSTLRSREELTGLFSAVEKERQLSFFLPSPPTHPEVYVHLSNIQHDSYLLASPGKKNEKPFTQRNLVLVLHPVPTTPHLLWGVFLAVSFFSSFIGILSTVSSFCRVRTIQVLDLYRAPALPTDQRYLSLSLSPNKALVDSLHVCVCVCTRMNTERLFILLSENFFSRTTPAPGEQRNTYFHSLLLFFLLPWPFLLSFRLRVRSILSLNCRGAFFTLRSSRHLGRRLLH